MDNVMIILVATIRSDVFVILILVIIIINCDFR